ncbi:MAG: phospholipid/cholesterol/gamma-HCH transport system substrate-binding protein [Acidobacteriota bacterium]
MKTEFKVGIFFLVTIAALVTLVLSLEKLGISSRQDTNIYTAYFDQVAGLSRQSDVRAAGVRVGKVESINLEGNKAKVVFSLPKNINVYSDAHVSLVSLGILGEKYIDFSNGRLTNTNLESGSTLKTVQGTGLDELVNVLIDVGKDMKAITESLNGEGGKLTSIMDNLDVMTSDLRVRIPRLAEDFQNAARTFNAFIKDNETETSGAIKDFRLLATKFQVTADNLNAMSQKINSGEGTLGKLLNDGSTGEKINKTLDSLESALSGYSNLDLRLDASAAYWADRSDARAGLRIEMAPQNDYWYSLDLNSSPDGKNSKVTRTTTSIDPITGLPTGIVSSQSTSISDKTVSLSAAFNKKVGNVVFSAGIFDGKGGGSIEVRNLNDTLRLGFTAYDFSKDSSINKNNPRYRFTSSYQFYKNFYIQAGVQDFANKDYRTMFVGGGIRWKDEDLKKLLGLAAVGR